MNKKLNNKIKAHNKWVVTEFKKSLNGRVINISDLLFDKEEIINLLEYEQNLKKL